MESLPRRLIPVSQVLHSSLLRAESSLARVAAARYQHNRHVMSNLMEIRARFARILVLYRWQKQHGKESDAGHERNNGLSVERGFSQMRKLMRNVVSKRQSTEVAVPEHLFVCPRAERKLSALDLVNLLELMRKQKIKRLNIVGRVVVLVAREFTACFKLGSGNMCRLDEVRIVWPAGVKQSASLAKAIQRDVARFRKFNPKSEGVFDRMFAVFRRYFINGQFLEVVRQIKQRESEFGYKVRKGRDGCSIDILFSKYFRTFSKVKCRMMTDRILLYSAVPLYFPVGEEREYVFSKSKCSTYKDAPRHFVSFSFQDASEANIAEKLTFIRNCILATRLRNIWMILTRALDSSPYLYLLAVINIAKIPSFDSISIITNFGADAPRTVLRICPHTGRLLISGNQMHGINIEQFRESLDLDVSTMSRIITLMKLSRLVMNHNSRFCAMNEVTHLDIDALNNQNSLFYLHLSYSRDFCVRCFMSPVHPDLEAVSKTGDVVEAKDILGFGQMTYNWKCCHYFEAIERARIKIAALQLQKRLTGEGFQVQQETERKLVIWLRPMMKVRLKLSTTMWSVSFQRSFYPFLQTGCTTFISHAVTCRYTEYIVHLIKDFTRMGMLCQCIEGACRDEEGGTMLRQYWYENAVNIHFRVDTFNIHLGLGSLRDSFNVREESEFVMNPCSPMKLFMNFSRTFPIQVNKIAELYSDQFGAWLRNSLPALFRLQQVFSQTRDWSTGYFSAHESISLIFRGTISLNVQWKFLQCFAFVIPNTGISRVLEVPLSIFPKLFSVPVTHPTYKVNISELEKLRDNVVWFCDDLKMIKTSGFVGMGKDPNSSFIRMKSGTRLTLPITATLKSSGISLECDSMPLLANICEQFRSIFNDRNKHRGALKVILEIAAFDPSFVQDVYHIVHAFQQDPWYRYIHWDVFFERAQMSDDKTKLTIFIQKEFTSLSLEFWKSSSMMIIHASSAGQSRSFQGLPHFLDWLNRCDPSSPFIL